MKQSTHGGRRPGAGRKSGPQGPRIKAGITMRPDQYEATKAARSGMVEAALDKWLTAEKAVNFVHVTDDGRRFEGKAIVTTEDGFEPDVLILTCEEQDEHGLFVRVFYPYGKEADASEADKALRRLLEISAIEAQ